MLGMYDALFVQFAQELDLPLLTSDAKLAPTMTSRKSTTFMKKNCARWRCWFLLPHNQLGRLRVREGGAGLPPTDGGSGSDQLPGRSGYGFKSRQFYTARSPARAEARRPDGSPSTRCSDLLAGQV